MRHQTAWLSLAVALPALVGMSWLVPRAAESDSQRAASGRMRPAIVTPADRTEAFTPADHTKAVGVSDRPPVSVPDTARAASLVPAAGLARMAAAPASVDPRLIDIIDVPAQRPDAADIKTYHPRMSAAAAAERDRSVGELAASGAGGSQWLEQMRQVEEDWLAIDNREGFGIEFDEWACYEAGCTVTMRSPSLEMLNQFSEFARDAAAMQNWHGDGRRSEPIQSDSGEVEATWVFDAPSG